MDEAYDAVIVHPLRDGSSSVLWKGVGRADRRRSERHWLADASHRRQIAAGTVGTSGAMRLGGAGLRGDRRRRELLGRREVNLLDILLIVPAAGFLLTLLPQDNPG